MKKYQKLQLTIITFSAKDVVCASDSFSGDWKDNNEI